MNTALMFSSKSDEWSTPQDFWLQLDSEFRFTCDVAASADTAKSMDWFGPDHVSAARQDALSVVWRGRCWMNPPYSRGLQGQFIAKAAAERLRGVLTVALIPARTDTRMFHEHIWWAHGEQRPRAGVEVRFVKGRLKFGGCKDAAPFPSMVVVFRP